MRKTWRLVYNYLLTFIGSFISKRRNARFAVGVLFVLGIGALMIFLFTNTAIATTVKFAQLGVPELAMYSNSFMAILIILFLTVMRSALPAKTTDEQLLLSLPIKKTQIILAKSLFNYLFDFLSLLGILFPSYIVYAVINRAGIALVFRGLLITALLPLFSNALATLIAMLFQKIATSFRNFSLVQTFLILLLIGGYVLASYALNDYLVSNTDLNAVLNRFKPMKWIMTFVLNGTLLSLLWIALISIGTYVISISLRVTVFGKEVKSYRSKKNDLNFNAKAPLWSLYQKEIKYYFSVPIYVINTIFGAIMYVGLAIVLLFIKQQTIIDIMSSMNIGASGAELAFILAAGCIIITTVCTTSSAISLEGKHLWILKAHPVKVRDVFLSKILVNMTLTTIPILLVAPVLGIKYGLANIWMFVLIPFLASLVIAILGLYFNLLFPKLEWESEMQPVKQGLSVMVSLFFGFAFVILPFVLYFAFLVNRINYLWFALMLLGYFAVWVAGSYFLLLKNGKTQFERL